MGNVKDHPSKEDLAQSNAGKLMQQFKEYVDRECKDCPHIKYCRGGCPYNAIAPTGGGEIKGVDPYCTAYKRIFNEITERLNKEMFESPMIEMTTFQTKVRKAAKPGIMTIIQKIVAK